MITSVSTTRAEREPKMVILLPARSMSIKGTCVRVSVEWPPTCARAGTCTNLYLVNHAMHQLLESGVETAKKIVTAAN